VGKRNEKNERKKSAILWTTVDNPGANTSTIRRIARERLEKAFGARQVPMFSSDFNNCVLELITRGVLIWWSHSFSVDHQSKHQVVWAPGPRVAYGKKRWPRNLVGEAEVEKVVEAPPEPKRDPNRPDHGFGCRCFLCQ
jgi:hypothetical protein